MTRIQSLFACIACSGLSSLLLISCATEFVNSEASSLNSHQRVLRQKHGLLSESDRKLFTFEVIPFEDENPGEEAGEANEEVDDGNPDIGAEVGEDEGDVQGGVVPERETESPDGQQQVLPEEESTVPQGPEPSPEPQIGTDAPDGDEIDDGTTEAQQAQAPSVVPDPSDLASPPGQSPTRPPQLPGFFASRSPTFAPRPDDFANFNEIFKNAVVAFPDLSIQENLLFQPLSISLTKFSCTKISFENIDIDFLNRSRQEIHLDLEVVNFAVTCDFDFKWSYIFLSGFGHAQVETGRNSALAGLDMYSDDFQTAPPDSAKVVSCQTDINIVRLAFSGNIASEIFNLFEQVIINVVDELLNEKICVEMNELGSNALDDAFGMVQNLTEPYLQPIEAWRLNASYPELELMDVGPNTSLISWNDEDGYGQFLAAGLDEIEEMLSSSTLDPYDVAHSKLYFPNGTKFPDGHDLGINVLIRDYLLEDDRAFILNLTQMDLNGSNVLYDEHDRLTDTKLSLQHVKVYGLDTFTKMKPFRRIGNYTLMNDLSWDFLQIEAIMMMEIKASSLNDSYISDSERIDPYVEEFRVSVGIKDIDIVASVLFALEPDQMRALQVGPMLEVITMIPCLMSSLYDFGLTRLNVTIGDISLPSLEGLVSPGLDRVLTDAMELGFLMYKPTLLKVIPSLFETEVRDILTELVKNASCPVYDDRFDTGDEYVDMRDLLLDPEESVAIGGTGGQQYGDLASTIYGILREMWLEYEEDGTLGLNSLLIDPITELLSGTPGLVSIPGTLYNFTTNDENQFELRTLVNSFEFGVYDLIIQNLDTVVHPMSIVQPISHPYITQTSLNMGPINDRPLNASITILLALDIEDSPLAMNNNITFGFSVASLELFVEALTMLSANNMLNYRLGDGLVFNCWLSMLPPPKLDYHGFRVDGAVDRGIELRRFFAKVSELKLDIECAQCSSGLASLPDIVDIFDRTKVTSILGTRVPLFLEEIAISQSFQVAFDRWLTDAPYHCPHRMEYDEDYKRPKRWKMPEFRSISVESSDILFFATVAAAQVAFVLLVETHYPWALDTLPPLSGQQNFVPPEGSNMIDWSDLDGNTTRGFDDLAEDARAYLREEQSEEGTDEVDLGINVLLRDVLLEEDGSVDFVDLLSDDPFEFSIQGLVFQFHSIKFRGLDSFTHFEALQPIAPQTILNSMHLSYLEIELVVSTGSRIDPPQNITAKFGFEDINASVPLFAAFDLNILQEIEIGHLLSIPQIFPCLMTASYGVQFPQILMTVGNFTVPTFEGFLPDSGEALKRSLLELYDRYAQKTLKALPVMLDTSIRAFVNTFIAEYIDTKTNCTHMTEMLLKNDTKVAQNATYDDDEEPPVFRHPYEGYVDFRELLLMPDNSTALGGKGISMYGTLIRSLVLPVQQEILWVNPATGLSGINSLIAPVTNFLSGENGTIFLEGPLIQPVEFDAEIGAFEARISLDMADLRIENLDTVGEPLSLAQPVLNKPQLLNHSSGIGVGGRPFRVSVLMSVQVKTWDGDTGEVDKNIANNISLSLELRNASAFFDTLVKVSESSLVHFPLGSVVHPWCWLSLIPAPELDRKGTRLDGVEPTISFQDLVVKVSQLALNISCVSCSSPGMQALSDALALPESSEAVTELANTVLRFGSNIVTGNLVQDALDRALNEGPRRCPHHPEYVPNAESLSFDPLNFDRTVATSSLLILLVCVAMALLGAISATLVLLKWIVWRRNRNWLLTLPARQVYILERQQEAAKQMETELNLNTTAMVIAKEIPLYVRYLMPVIIIGNIALFLSGHLNIAAETRLEAQIAGEPFSMEQFFQFSIMQSTIDMWTAGAKEMAVFILIFSGIWPYVKQFTTLYCWLTPPTRLSISKRGSIYLWLDTLAKWSMVDIFVLLVSMIAFRVEAVTPDVPFLPNDFFSLEVVIIPRWGMYANLIAQMISQISSHFIIHYHRMIVIDATKGYEDRHHAPRNQTPTVQTASESDDEEAEAMKRKRLCDNAFTRPHKGHLSRLVTRRSAGYALLSGVCLLIISLTAGCAISSVGVEVQGMISFVAGVGSGVYKEFDVFSIAKLLMDDARKLGGGEMLAAYLFLSLIVLSTVFFVPVFQSLALLYHWFKPMNDQERKTFSVVIEILGAWQYAEVFILALFISAWQLAPTSETVMAEQCDEFESIFEMLTYYGVLDLEDGHCFRVQASILEGSYFLAAGAILLAFCNSFIMKASSQYFWDKDTARKALAMEKQVPENVCDVTQEGLKKIKPPPVLFTDTYRWILRRETLADTGGRPVDESRFFFRSAPPESARPDQENISSASSGS